MCNKDFVDFLKESFDYFILVKYNNLVKVFLLGLDS